MDAGTLSKNNRLVFAYHGCERQLRDQVLRGEEELKESNNDYDWLGKGIYFWENGPTRALEWAKDLKKRGKINEPAVIGAIIDLGNCFDLLDVRYPKILQSHYPLLKRRFDDRKLQLPQNLPAGANDHDLLLRKRDCLIVNSTIALLNSTPPKVSIDTVRSVFQEGGAAFDGSGFFLKSHIQIAVRNPACIRGYFLPK
jgi:hypothetical protein